MTREQTPPTGPPARDIEISRDLAWPIGIVVALLLVVAVNVAFIYIAVSGADEVVESYEAETR